MNHPDIQAFEKLKELMMRDVLLRFPDFDAADGERHFHFLTDSSRDGFGAILCQKDEQTRSLRPLYFASQRASKTDVVSIGSQN